MIKKITTGQQLPTGVAGEVIWAQNPGAGTQGKLLLFDGAGWRDLPFTGTYEDCVKFWEAFRTALTSGVTTSWP